MRGMKINQAVATLVGIIVVVLFFIILSFSSTFAPSQGLLEEEGGTTPMNTEGLVIQDLKEGDGAEAAPGKTLIVHYVGTFPDGTQFDSSRDRGQPFQFVLGAGSVIRGWEQGLIGIREGGLRKLTVPPALGYGTRQAGPIPPNSTLVFEVELLEVK